MMWGYANAPINPLSIIFLITTMECNMQESSLYIRMVINLMNDIIYETDKDIETIENLPNYLDNRDYRNDVIHLNGRIKGLELLKEKIDILF